MDTNLELSSRPLTPSISEPEIFRHMFEILKDILLFLFLRIIHHRGFQEFLRT